MNNLIANRDAPSWGVLEFAKDALKGGEEAVEDGGKDRVKGLKAFGMDVVDVQVKHALAVNDGDVRGEPLVVL